MLMEGKESRKLSLSRRENKKVEVEKGWEKWEMKEKREKRRERERERIEVEGVGNKINKRNSKGKEI